MTRVKCRKYHGSLYAAMIALLLFSMGWPGHGHFGNTAHAVAPAVWFVKVGGTGNGTSWDQAFGDLQTALDAARMGDQIWVAGGTYYPKGNQIGSDARTVHFRMKNGVAIYGGFSGTESRLEQRDIHANRTIFSGDIDPFGDEDAYHVFYHKGLKLNASAVLDGVTISGGRADAAKGPDHNRGGGMFNETSSPTLRNVVFTDNRASLLGGGMYNERSNPVLTNVTFTGNAVHAIANGNGGGMANVASEPTLINVTFSGNTASADGGGLYNFLSHPNLENVLVTGNQANYGGGLYNRDSKPVLEHVTISYNTAFFDGGGLYNIDGNPVLEQVTITDNYANYGGGLYNFNSSPLLTNVTIRNNEAASEGGGLYNFKSGPKLTGVKVSGNRSSSRGGGLYNLESSPVLTNVAVTGNRSNYGGGLFNMESKPTLTNVTVAGNRGIYGGGGIYGIDGSLSFIRNSIVWGNDESNIEGDVAVVNSIVGHPGDPDPLFVDPRLPIHAPTADGNYRLQENSPAINAGVNAVYEPGAEPDLSSIKTDLDGHARILGGNVDLGAYEFQLVTVFFDKNGGDAEASPSVITTVYGGTVGTLPTPPARTGYEFIGWNTAPDGGGDPFDGATPVYDDTVVYAQWTSSPYVVFFDRNGGDTDASPSVIATVYGGTVGTLPMPPTRRGFVFAGWNTAPDGRGDPFDAATPVFGKMTVFAKWKARSSGGGGSPAHHESWCSGLPSCGTGEVLPGDNVMILMPAGSAGEPLALIVREVPDPARYPANGHALISPVYEVATPFPDHLDHLEIAIVLVFAFDSSALGKDQVPAVFHYDEEAKEWKKVPGGLAFGDQIATEVNRFGKFAVFAVDPDAEDTGEGKQEISFSDIAGHWAENMIKQAAKTGIIAASDPDAPFKPNDPVTRGDFAVMLARALQLEGTSDPLFFVDQDKLDAQARQAIALTVQAGIISGYEDGSFRPDAPITRAEMGTMIARALKLPFGEKEESGFSDHAVIPSWARGPVEAIRKLGIVVGRDGNKFVPNGQATRAEAISMLFRMLDHLP